MCESKRQLIAMPRLVTPELHEPHELLDHNRSRIPCGLRIFHIERSQMLYYDLRDDEIAIPLAIGGHDIPRRVIGGGASDHFLISRHEFSPMRAILDIIGIKLPVLFGLAQARLQTRLLLIGRDVQEKLHDGRAFVHQHAFKVDDVTVAFFPNLIGP